jgi:hypothetical protein
VWLFERECNSRSKQNELIWTVSSVCHDMLSFFKWWWNHKPEPSSLTCSVSRTQSEITQVTAHFISIWAKMAVGTDTGFRFLAWTRTRFPAWTRTFIFATASRPALRQEREANDSLPSSTTFRNAWSYSPISPYIFMVLCLIKHRDKFISLICDIATLNSWVLLDFY